MVRLPVLMWLAIAVTACGRIGFDPGGAGDTFDASVDATSPCSAYGPFGTPVHVPELAGPGDEAAPTLSADELVIMFERNTAGMNSPYSQLWSASRPTVTSPFSTPTLVAELSTIDNELNPSLSPDGLTVYFARNVVPQKPQIYVATRADRSSPFGAPMLLMIDHMDANDVFAPEISDDGQELIFNRFAGVPQNSSILRAEWDAQAGRFQARGALEPGMSELDIGIVTNDFMEEWASLSSDALSIYYMAVKCGPSGFPCPELGASWQIYTADRPAIGAPFGTPRAMPEFFAAGATTGDPELSSDGRVMWLASDRPGSVGGFDIWMSTRACL